MDKKVVLLGLIAVFALSTGLSYAADDNITLYKDGIGRIHFLGKDPAANRNNYNYANPAAQDLTRKLYDENREVNNDTSFDQHPLKNYENTFSDFRFTNYYKKRYQFNPDSAGQPQQYREGTVKGGSTAQKGVSELNNGGVSTQLNSDILGVTSDGAKNVISDKKPKKEKKKKDKKKKK